MTDEEYVAKIMQMTKEQLLDHIMGNPTDLTDPYYREFGRVIQKRYEQLNQQKGNAT